MLVQNLDMILVMATDMDRSIAFYRDTLELPLRSHHGEFALFDTGNVPLGLHGGAESGDVPASRGTLPAFGVADYDEAKATLESRGCTFHFENSTPGARFGSFLDPDGNPLQIIQRIG